MSDEAAWSALPREPIDRTADDSNSRVLHRLNRGGLSSPWPTSDPAEEFLHSGIECCTAQRQQDSCPECQPDKPKRMLLGKLHDLIFHLCSLLICPSLRALLLLAGQVVPRTFCIRFFCGQFWSRKEPNHHFNEAFEPNQNSFHFSSICTKRCISSFMWVTPLTYHYTQKWPKVNDSPV